MLFSYVLDRCRGLEDIDTVFILVDNRNLTSETTTEESLAHWPTVAPWWKSRMLLTGPARNCAILSSSQSARPVGCRIFTPRGLAPLSLQHCALSFLRSTLYSLIMTAFLSRFLKSETCGEKHTLRGCKAHPVGEPVSVPGTQAKSNH